MTTRTVKWVDDVEHCTEAKRAPLDDPREADERAGFIIPYPTPEWVPQDWASEESYKQSCLDETDHIQRMENQQLLGFRCYGMVAGMVLQAIVMLSYAFIFGVGVKQAALLPSLIVSALVGWFVFGPIIARHKKRNETSRAGAFGWSWPTWARCPRCGKYSMEEYGGSIAMADAPSGWTCTDCDLNVRRDDHMRLFRHRGYEEEWYEDDE